MARYGPKAGEMVGKMMHAFKRGTLHSGRNTVPVRSREQAIAIGLSKARAAGGKVPKQRKHARGR